MNAIIPDIDTLKKVVKINATLPDEAINPYIDDAMDIYLTPYIGIKTVEKALTGTDKRLNDKILRTLGPLTLMLATPELGIRIGDSGITVENKQGTYSPANEAKIAAAKESFYFRGMQALDRLLIRDTREFQDTGLVNIEYSTVSFRMMLPTVRQLQERNVREMLKEDLYQRLLDAHTAGKELTPKEKVLLGHILRYLANKTAELYTSQTSREQRAINDTPEFTPIIRPIYQDQAATGNFFADQATYYAGKIQNFISENAGELGVTPTVTAINFNSKEKRIFTSIS